MQNFLHFPHQSTSIWFVICDLHWHDMLQGSLHLILQTHLHTHSPPPFFLQANLSDLSHPRAFSSFCPSWTLVHLGSSGGILHGSAWSLALQLGLTPSGGWGGRDSAPRQQQSVKSFRLWQENLGDMYTRAHVSQPPKHTHIHTCCPLRM